MTLNFKALGIGQLTKVVETLEKSQAGFDAMGKSLKENTKLLGGLADNNIVRFFDTMTNKMYDLGQSAQALKDVNGPLGLMQMKFAELNGVMANLGATTVIGKIKLVGTLLSSWLAPLAAIAAAIWLFTRLWKENIGGIQTKWIAFMGNLKNTWSKFEIGLRKFLHEIEPIFSAIMAGGFGLLQGVVEGFIATMKVFIGIVRPFLLVISKVFAVFAKNGDDASKSWTEIGKVLGMVVGGILAITAAIKVAKAVMLVFNIITSMNPIGLIVLAVGALILIFVKLQQKFNIFGKAWKAIKDGFMWFWNILKKIFSFAIQTSPLFQGIKLVMKAIKWITGKNKDKDEEGVASNRAAEAVNNGGNVSNRQQDNRQANVTIYTNDMDKQKANDIGTQFVSPVVSANKSI